MGSGRERPPWRSSVAGKETLAGPHVAIGEASDAERPGFLWRPLRNATAGVPYPGRAAPYGRSAAGGAPRGAASGTGGVGRGTTSGATRGSTSAGTGTTAGGAAGR